MRLTTSIMPRDENEEGGDDLSALGFLQRALIFPCVFKVDPSIVLKPQPCIFDERTVRYRCIQIVGGLILIFYTVPIIPLLKESAFLHCNVTPACSCEDGQSTRTSISTRLPGASE